MDFKRETVILLHHYGCFFSFVQFLSARKLISTCITSATCTNQSECLTVEILRAQKDAGSTI